MTLNTFALAMQWIAVAFTLTLVGTLVYRRIKGQLTSLLEVIETATDVTAGYIAAMLIIAGVGGSAYALANIF